MTFVVFDADGADDDAQRRSKARLEIVAVDERSSRCRIVQEDLQRPIEIGDIIEPAISKAAAAQVTKVSDNYAVISIGSAAGLRDGQVLEVLRKSEQDQQPGSKTIEYLGQLRIIDVQVEASVGEFLPTKRDVTIAVGDTVVSEF
jgi:DUF917 family protein